MSIILFEAERTDGSYYSRQDLEAFAQNLQLEIVPLIATKEIRDLSELKPLMESAKPVLGGGVVEGFVVKRASDRRDRFKVITEEYKEVNTSKRRTKEIGEHIATQMGRKYCTSSRWHKAVERLRDEGQIEDSTKDIGKIIQEVHRDMDKECKEMIAEELYQDARKKIMTAACQGLADWYKDRLIHGASFTDEMGARKLEN